MTKLILAAALLGLGTAAAAQTPAAPSGSGDITATTHEGRSFDQWAAQARDRMMTLDTNHDGKISKDEFAARTQMMADHRGGGDGDKQGDKQGGHHDGSRMFDRFDTNQDGYIDASEITAMLAARFARMDANHDGMLTPDERHAMRGGNAAEQ